MALAIVLLVFRGCPCRFPVVDHLLAGLRGRAEVTGDWQPTEGGTRLSCDRPAVGRAEDLSN